MNNVSNFSFLSGLIKQSLSDPKTAAARVLNLNLSVEVLRILFALVVILSVCLSQIRLILLPLPDDMAVNISILTLGGIQVAMIAIWILATHYIGRLFGGVGTLRGAVVITLWMQVIGLIGEVALFLGGLVLPGLFPILFLGIVGYLCYISLNFIAVLHRFQSLILVFLGVIGSSFVIAFVIVFILAALGLLPEVPVT